VDKSKLDSATIEKFIKALKGSETNSLSDYSAPEKLKKDEEKTTQAILDGQIPTQRTALLYLIICLTIASFLLLAFVVLWQMLWPIRHPTYRGINDAVIKVLATGVFAELVGVVAVIARLVWKDRK
jgi:hypothetical protein